MKLQVFRGWVPTITGNLSFATIGQGRQPKRAFKVARAATSERYIVVAQKRRTTDVPFGRLGDLLNYLLLRREGYTVYTLFGKSILEEDYDLLTGPCVELTQNEFNLVKKSLEPLKNRNLPDEDFRSLFEELAKIFSEKTFQPGCGLSAIELYRNGRIDISVDLLDEKEAQDVASQIFFFLRDVCHVHQHHAPTSDTIVDVVPVASGETHWKRETLYALYRWVIQQKRSRDPSAYIDAKGVLAYACAFTEKHCGTDEHDQKLPQYLRKATIDSLDAGLSRKEYEERVRNRLPDTLFNKVLPLIVISLIVFSIFYRSPDLNSISDQQLLLSQFSNWLNTNVLSVFGTLFFLIVTTSVVFVYRSQIFRRPLWFDLFRALFPIPYILLVVI